MNDIQLLPATGLAGVTELIMARDTALNALSAAQADGIADAARTVAADPNCRALIVRSALPKVFCVGADLKERSGLTSEEILSARQHSIAATEALLAIEIPTIASVHGFALGGGLELALTCDIIVADHSAILGLPETGVGIIPGGGGTQLLTRRVGLSRASELIFTGRKIDAETAHDYGLVDILAATDQSAYEAAEELARLITCNSPVSVRNAKAALRGGIGLPLWEGLALEDTRWRASALSTDYREGLAAFLERRAPSWPG